MVVVNAPPMSKGFPLILGAGPIPELAMRQACEAIAVSCGCGLLSFACGESPHEVLASTESASDLRRLCGDTARFHRDGGSWLEALADWRQPVLLLVPGEADARNSWRRPGLCRALPRTQSAPSWLGAASRGLGCIRTPQRRTALARLDSSCRARRSQRCSGGVEPLAAPINS